MICSQSRPGFEHVSPCPFPTTITTTPWAPPLSFYLLKDITYPRWWQTIKSSSQNFYAGPVGWGCRIHRLHLCRGVWLPNECPTYDTKQSDGEVHIVLELGRMRSIPLLLSLPGPLWPWVVAPDRVQSMAQIELNCVLMLNWMFLNRTVFTFNCVQKNLYIS